MSASGKSTISQQLVDKMGVIRIRSDIERKRLFEINTNQTTAKNNNADSGTNTTVDSGIYSKQASQQTYTKLASLASDVINAGYSVIIDAAFLKYEQRQLFQKLTERLKVPFVILEVSAPTDILRQRIVQRKNDISDADLVVLEHQLKNYQPLQPDEASEKIAINTEKTLDIGKLIASINNIE
ncbi:MAG: AAA family ATPase, partial [Gammaproteobacteria bacterium]|nr:AAA family ATPase [Gammaproteobacteria bacterium]